MKGEKYDENGRVADPTAEENKKFTVPNQPEQLVGMKSCVCSLLTLL